MEIKLCKENGGREVDWRNATEIELEILQQSCQLSTLRTRQGGIGVIGLDNAVYVRLYRAVKLSHQAPSTNLGTHIFKIRSLSLRRCNQRC